MRVRDFSLRPWQSGLLAGFAWVGLFSAAYRPFLFRRLYRQMKNGRPEGAPVELEIVGNELISRVPGFSEGRFLRPSIREHAEDSRTFILYISKRAFLLLPKNRIPEHAFADLRTWLATPPSTPS